MIRNCFKFITFETIVFSQHISRQLVIIRLTKPLLHRATGV